MPRLAPPNPATYSERQQAVADAISSGPRGGVRGPLAIWLLRIWIAGIIAPLLILWLAPTYQAVIAAAVGVLIGHYAYRVLIFKAGVFEPIMSFRP